MSINVTVNGNHLNIRRGRMVLSDLDQIKKNERDRRRRLRLEQVRQQSKEISDRLLERAKNIAKEELKKLETNDKLNLRQIHNEKIMEVQQKYQEDMADIGQAHISATLEPDYNAIMKEKDRQNKLAALKRGKEAIKQMKNIQQESVQQQQHEERLRQVREVENLRSTMIAKLPQKTISEKDTVRDDAQEEESKQHKPAKKKVKKFISKKSPGKITKSYIKVVGSDLRTHSSLLKSKTKNDSVVEQRSKTSLDATPSVEQTVCITQLENNRHSGEEVLNASTKKNKTTRYNPEDYAQATSNSTNSDSISSFSDDSSYFSDNNEQSTKTRTSKYIKCPAAAKVQLYDHSKHQSNTYDKPVGVVEKIHTWSEPSAIDLAQTIEQAETVETHLLESRKYNAQKRGEDAALREKVRRDYQTLMQNLNQLASEERKLKASQVERYPKSTHTQEHRRILRDQHKKKLNHAVRSLLSEECLEQCVSQPMERQITLPPRVSNGNVDVHGTWEEPCCSKRADAKKISRKKCEEEEESREEQILDMLKKVERQKRLLLQEFGVDLPNDIFNASMKPLFEKEKSVQTESQENANVPKPSSPEIRVINVPQDKNDKKGKSDSPIKTAEIAVQTTTGDKRSIVEDKGTQVELTQEDKDKAKSDTETVTKHYPLEPKITVITHETDNESSSSVTTNAVIDADKPSSKATPKKTKRSVKTSKRVPSKTFQKSSSTRISKASPSLKKCPKSRYPKKANTEDESSNRIKMYVDENGLNIKVQPPPVTEVAVDVSTQSSQLYSPSIQEQSTSKPHWIQSRSRIKIRDFSDTSTSFASPPPIKPRDILEALTNNISILELLDSSVNESMKRLKGDISPVSTPETPSPRTMRLPSNIPHPEKITKLLKSRGLQTNESNSLSSVRNSCSTSTDLSDELPSNQKPAALPKFPVSLEFCLCNNPNCNQMHAKFDEIRSYALKNCPQILQRYEDLQTTCAERIISLTNLIEKVRNEQKGMEFSIITADDTSLMQLPSPKFLTNDLQSVRKLVENIEAVHNQLAKTLIESQKIIKSKAVKDEGNQTKEKQIVIVEKSNTPKKVTDPVESKGVLKDKVKPKIIRDEKVNIRLDRFQLQAEPGTSTVKSGFRLVSKHNEEEMIEKLSKEILEQSKSFNNNVMVTKEVSSSRKHSIETSTDVTDSKDNASMNKSNDRVTAQYSTKEQKKNKDFIPILTDIPKVTKAVDTTTYTNGRSKPPVSLFSGPYRAEIESSGHELSTIIEFDTPDTINKSQNNVRSPSSTKRVAETQVIKSTDIAKPGENVHLLNLRNQRLEKECNSSIKKFSSVVGTQKIKEVEIFSDSPKTSKSTGGKDVIQETSNKKLQYNMANQESLQMEESVGTDPPANKHYINNKDKITSTSSNSFSELSGISQIASTPSSTILKYASSPEEMETALKKLGLGWAITTLKKTREASALSSSSNSDVTPINTAKRISPVKKQFDNNYGLPDISDVSSISIKEASKSTEQAVLLKGRTSTPKLQNSNSNSIGSNSTNTNVSENFQEPNNGLIIPNISLTKTKSNIKTLENV
ncbi:uncharacterized protein LOC117608993 [Osmia lignaria lignaria]|uniref:uncharacterized protein LOC117608993 n=1 Tax=Osmia lignaria lignaria TaxID=1437193 RepID=UPI001479081B|nr:uncharacterized protein LOC117608993 [Osmia lignaria]